MQRVNIKILVDPKKTVTETLDLLREAYGENAVPRSRVFEWLKMPSDGKEIMENGERPDHPVAM